METTSIPDYPRGVTFEQVWAALMEDREQLKETAKQQKETDRIVKENAEQQKEIDSIVKETAKRQKEIGEQMGYLSNRFGELAEHLVAPGIHDRFNELGYHFQMMATKGCTLRGEDGKTRAEIDLLLENDDIYMAVEVKAKPKVKHIEEHIKRLEILRDTRRKLNHQRQVEGAIAGAIFGIEEKKATIEAGLYVIEQSGDTMKINVPDGFVPRRW